MSLANEMWDNKRSDLDQRLSRIKGRLHLMQASFVDFQKSIQSSRKYPFKYWLKEELMIKKFSGEGKPIVWIDSLVYWDEPIKLKEDLTFESCIRAPTGELKIFYENKQKEMRDKKERRAQEEAHEALQAEQPQQKRAREEARIAQDKRRANQQEQPQFPTEAKSKVQAGTQVETQAETQAIVAETEVGALTEETGDFEEGETTKPKDSQQMLSSAPCKDESVRTTSSCFLNDTCDDEAETNIYVLHAMRKTRTPLLTKKSDDIEFEQEDISSTDIDNGGDQQDGSNNGMNGKKRNANDVLMESARDLAIQRKKVKTDLVDNVANLQESIKQFAENITRIDYGSKIKGVLGDEEGEDLYEHGAKLLCICHTADHAAELLANDKYETMLEHFDSTENIQLLLRGIYSLLFVDLEKQMRELQARRKEESKNKNKKHLDTQDNNEVEEGNSLAELRRLTIHQYVKNIGKLYAKFHLLNNHIQSVLLNYFFFIIYL